MPRRWREETEWREDAGTHRDDAEVVHPGMKRVYDEVRRVVIGKEIIIQKCLVVLASGGHLLLEDVPGVGKTVLVQSLARSLGLSFKRIQFTPDLLPSDVTGLSVYNQKTAEFEFRPGPIMGNLILADEINRTSPKTQSALLEAMGEGKVTVDGKTYDLPRPFFVMATQNPIEYEGTFSLPEAQLDRFLMKLKMGYPTPAEEVAMLGRMQQDSPLEHLEPVADARWLLEVQEEVRKVNVSDSVKQYIVELANATRHHAAIYLGVSPRGTLALFRASQALAYLRGRNYVIPDDVKWLVQDVLSHRLILAPEVRLNGAGAEDVLRDLVKNTAVPVLRG